MRSYVYYTKERNERLSVRFVSTGCILVKDDYGIHEYGWWKRAGRYGYEYSRFEGRKPSFDCYMEDMSFHVAQDFLLRRRYGDRTNTVYLPSDEQ